MLPSLRVLYRSHACHTAIVSVFVFISVYDLIMIVQLYNSS